jgi:Spy/CpxP family protein refolding chaperone
VTAEEMAEHIGHHVERVLSGIGTTDEQTAQITSIVQAAAQDVHAMHDQHGAARQELKEILSAPSIDRSRLEALRADHVRLADEASKRVVTALADAADVLTPEQRAAAAQKIEKHHLGWRGGDH